MYVRDLNDREILNELKNKKYITLLKSLGSVLEGCTDQQWDIYNVTIAIFLFQINAILLNYLFTNPEKMWHGFHKNIKQHNYVFNI